MQDRFKFRVWSKKYNKFIEDNRYPIGSDYQLIITQSGTLIKLGLGDFEDDCEDSYSWATFDDYEQDCILMQCTGLKDKNGKLIYEGDIVKFKDQIKINGSKTHISVVEFNEQFNTYMYHAECMGLYTINKAQNKQFDVEVIGNIYENPELLED